MMRTLTHLSLHPLHLLLQLQSRLSYLHQLLALCSSLFQLGEKGLPARLGLTQSADQGSHLRVQSSAKLYRCNEMVESLQWRNRRGRERGCKVREETLASTLVLALIVAPPSIVFTSCLHKLCA